MKHYFDAKFSEYLSCIAARQETQLSETIVRLRKTETLFPKFNNVFHLRRRMKDVLPSLSVIAWTEQS